MTDPIRERPGARPLPPYAPELNPVENVWALLRANKLSNRVFDTYESIVDACCDAWNWLTRQRERITFIATRPLAQVSQLRRAYKRAFGNFMSWLSRASGA